LNQTTASKGEVSDVGDFVIFRSTRSIFDGRRTNEYGASRHERPAPTPAQPVVEAPLTQCEEVAPNNITASGRLPALRAADSAGPRLSRRGLFRTGSTELVGCDSQLSANGENVLMGFDALCRLLVDFLGQLVVLDYQLGE
jgi:hypothetical protein